MGGGGGGFRRGGGGEGGRGRWLNFTIMDLNKLEKEPIANC